MFYVGQRIIVANPKAHLEAGDIYKVTKVDELFIEGVLDMDDDREANFVAGMDIAEEIFEPYQEEEKCEEEVSKIDIDKLVLLIKDMDTVISKIYDCKVSELYDLVDELTDRHQSLYDYVAEVKDNESNKEDDSLYQEEVARFLNSIFGGNK